MECKAVSDAVCQLLQKKRRLTEIIDREERQAYFYNRFGHLETTQKLRASGLQRIRRYRAEIMTVERLIDTVVDDLDRKILVMRSEGKSWAAICTTVYLSENACMRRFHRVCAALFTSLHEAGLIRSL